VKNNLESFIVLREIELKVHLGWPDIERTQEQIVLLDIKIQFKNPPQACVSDSLKDTICYDVIINNIRAHLAARKFRLLEHLGHEIYSQLKKIIMHDAAISICVTKKPNIFGLASASFGYGDLA
jgi:FolB domain-containing protein